MKSYAHRSRPALRTGEKKLNRPPLKNRHSRLNAYPQHAPRIFTRVIFMRNWPQTRIQKLLKAFHENGHKNLRIRHRQLMAALHG